MSVFAQQLEYVCNALRVLNASSDNQYGIRGQPPVDKVTSHIHYTKFYFFKSTSEGSFDKPLHKFLIVIAPFKYTNVYSSTFILLLEKMYFVKSLYFSCFQ